MKSEIAPSSHDASGTDDRPNQLVILFITVCFIYYRLLSAPTELDLWETIGGEEFYLCDPLIDASPVMIGSGIVQSDHDDSSLSSA